MKYFAQFAALLALLLSFGQAGAQDVWSLERAVRYAQDNNIIMQQARSSVRTALLSERSARASRLPNVGGQINAGQQYGRTIDPTTNEFNNTSIGYSSLGLSAGVSVFNGGLIHHSIKQADYEVQAAEADAEQTSNDLALQVAQAYLSIMLGEDQLANANRRVLQTQRQLEVTEKLIDAGSIPAGDRFNLVAQIAREEQAVITAQNSVELGYLALKQLLQLEPDYDLRIERPEIRLPEDDAAAAALTLPALYNSAQTTQASIRAGEFRRKAAETGINIARSAYYPSVSLFGSLSSNYSTQFRTPVYDGTFTPTNPETVYVNGQPVEIYSLVPNYSLQRTPYLDQIDQNFGQSVGVNIDIPIYQNGRVRLSVERARLALLNTELQNTQVRQQLKNDIQTAIANVRAGRKQIEAAQRSFEAMQNAYSNTEKRYSLGSANSLDLTTAKNNLDLAENELLVARYDFLFRLKILDFYQGKPLNLE
jgi:outer membrane protein